MDHEYVRTEPSVGTNSIGTLTPHHTGSHTDTPSNVDFGSAPPHTTKCEGDPVDVEGDIGNIKACFPGSSSATIMGALSVNFLVDDDIIPMKIQRLPTI
jgi:hypothetical protein